MATCFIRNSGSNNLIERYGLSSYRQMEEWGLSGVAPEVSDRRTGKLVASPLYQDIYNRLPSNLDSKIRAEIAFEIFTKAHSDEFFKKYGDWLHYPTEYSEGRYSSTGEPKLYVLEKEDYFKEYKEDRKQKESTLEKSLKFLEGTISELENKLEILKRKVVGSEDIEEINRLELLIDNIQKSLDNKKIEAGVKSYLQYLNDDVIPVFKEKVDNSEEEEVGSYIVNNMADFLSTHKENILRLKRALRNSKEYYNFYKSEVEPILNQIESNLSDLESFVADYIEDKSIEIAQEIYTDEDKEVISSWFKDTIKDIGLLAKTFGIPTSSSDPVIRLIVELIRKIHYRIGKIVNPVIDNLLTKQSDLNKAGFTDMSIFNERVNGKKSGFLISEYRWGEYYIRQMEMRDKIVEKTGLENWETVLRYIRNLEKDTQKDDKYYKIFKEEIDKFNKEYRDEKGLPKPKKNKEFDKMIQNKAFSEYYDALYNIHSKAKEAQPSKFRTGMNWWLLPQIRNDYLEAIKTGGVKKGAKVALRKAKEIVKTTEEDIEFGDIKRDKNGKILKLVPLHYNSRLENQEELSDDISSMYYRYYQMAENFRQVNRSIDDVEIIHRAMGAREIETPRSVELAKDIIESQLYGQKLNDMTVKVGNKEFNMSKLIDTMLVKYPSAVNMFMNIPVAASGFLKSKVDTQIENLVGKHTTFESARQATTEFIKQVPGVLAEVGNKTKTNRLDLLLKYNQIDDIIIKQYRNLNIDTQAGRVLTSDLTYAAMMPTGYISLGTLALSVYYNYRLVDGEFITKNEFDSKYKNTEKKWSDYKDKSLYNAYTIKDGKFVVKEEYSKYINEEFEYKISKKINALSNRLEGRLSSLDKGSIYRNPWGRGVMLHRGWIPQLASIRFKPRGIDFELGEETEGYYRTAARIAMNMVGVTDGTIKFKLAKWDTLEEFEKRNVIRLMGDAIALLAIYILARVINNIADGDDEDKWNLEFSAYVVNRLLLEHRAFWNPTEFFNVLKSPAAAINQWQKITNMHSLLFHGGDVIQSGAYKDKSKWERFFIQQSLLKNLYEIQYPKEKNTYLKSQIL